MKKWMVISGLFGLVIFPLENIGLFPGAQWGHFPFWGEWVLLTAFPIFWYASTILERLPENQNAFLALVNICLAATQFMAIGAASYWTRQTIKNRAMGKTALVSALAGLLVFITLLFFNPYAEGVWGWGIFPPILFPLFPTSFPLLHEVVWSMVSDPFKHPWDELFLLVHACLALAQFVFYGTVLRRLLLRFTN